MLNTKYKILIFSFLLSSIIYHLSSISVSAQIAPESTVKTSGEGLISKVAPGEIMPISVSLQNFGLSGRADVTITYSIKDKDENTVFTQTETVAVQTTASYVKNIPVPYELKPGRYTIISEITYQGQKVPAFSSSEFTIENKIAGIFISDFLIYGSITLFVGLIFAVVSRLIIKRRASRLALHEYSHIPKPKRIFYEMVSDMIMQMHNSIGDRAYEMASKIDGLSIDKDNGMVLNITKDPTEIVTLLLIQYQKIFRNEFISPREIDEKTGEHLHPVEENIEIINKYFSK